MVLSSLSRVANESLVAFPDGKRVLPGAPSCDKLLYWHRMGLRKGLGLEPDEPSVRLEAIRIGATLHTSHEAFARFLAAINRRRP